MFLISSELNELYVPMPGSSYLSSLAKAIGSGYCASVGSIPSPFQKFLFDELTPVFGDSTDADSVAPIALQSSPISPGVPGVTSSTLSFALTPSLKRYAGLSLFSP